MAVSTLHSPVGFGETVLNHQYIRPGSTMSLDDIFSNYINANDTNTLMIEVVGNITSLSGNHFLIWGWLNGLGSYGMLLIISFNGIWYARRSNSTTWAITPLN